MSSLGRRLLWLKSAARMDHFSQQNQQSCVHDQGKLSSWILTVVWCWEGEVLPVLLVHDTLCMNECPSCLLSRYVEGTCLLFSWTAIHTWSLNWSLTDNTNRASLFKLFFLVLKTSFFSHLTRVKECIDWKIVLTRATINSDFCIWIMFNIIFILKKIYSKVLLELHFWFFFFKSECLILT